MKLRWWTEPRHLSLGTAGASTPVGLNALHGHGGGHDWVGTNEVWTGTDANETHNGTNGDDTLDGAGGNDTLNGLDGNDILIGGFGNDKLYGGDGNDAIHAGSGSHDVVDGGKGNDTIIVDSGGGVIASLDGGKGNDTLDASGVTLPWFIQSDTSIEHWILSGLDDTFGGEATDEIWEGRGGNDIINAAGGNDTVLGGEGDDRLTGGAGDDSIDGGNGYDVAIFSDSPVGVTASLKTGVATGDGTDSLANIEVLIGSTHDDHLTGNNGDNELAGREGNDVLDGGKGNDYAYYDSTSSAVTVNLAAGTASGALGNDTLMNIENIVSGGGNDALTGNNGANFLYGGDGADTMSGGDGNDYLFGGNGDDTLTGGDGTDVMYGGAGADHFVFAALAHSSVDPHYIIDLDSTDTIDLSAIDAIRGGADQAFIVVLSFNGSPGEAIMSYDSGTNTTLIELDTDGGASPTANFVIAITGDWHNFSNIVW